MADGHPDLLVDADLSVSVDPAGWVDREAPAEARVWSDGDTVTVEVPSFAVARALLSGLESAPVRDPGRVGAWLSDVGLTLRIRVRYATVAVVGRRADPGPVERRLGVDAELGAGGALVALVRRL